MSSGEQLKTVERALQVLEALGRRPRSYTLAELTRTTGIHRAILRRIVVTLGSQGFVERDSVTLSYRLGPTALGLAQDLADEEIVTAARSVIPKLASETQETVWLAIADEGDVVCIDQIECAQLLRVVRPVGYRHPLHVGAAGLAILAFMPNEQREALFKVWRNAPVDPSYDPDKVRKRLAEVRAQGYALTSGEIAAGATGLCAPIFGRRGGVVASVGVVGPAIRFGRNALKRRIALVRRTAADISKRLSGYDSKISK